MIVQKVSDTVVLVTEEVESLVWTSAGDVSNSSSGWVVVVHGDVELSGWAPGIICPSPWLASGYGAVYSSRGWLGGLLKASDCLDERGRRLDLVQWVRSFFVFKKSSDESTKSQKKWKSSFGAHNLPKRCKKRALVVEDWTGQSSDPLCCFALLARSFKNCDFGR